MSFIVGMLWGIVDVSLAIITESVWVGFMWLAVGLFFGFVFKFEVKHWSL